MRRGRVEATAWWVQGLRPRDCRHQGRRHVAAAAARAQEEEKRDRVARQLREKLEALESLQAARESGREEERSGLRDKIQELQTHFEGQVCSCGVHVCVYVHVCVCVCVCVYVCVCV